MAEKGLPGPRGLDGEPGLPGSPGTLLLFYSKGHFFMQCSLRVTRNQGDTCFSCLIGFALHFFFHQVAQVSPGRTVSLVYQEQRVNLDSQASDSQDPRELKVKMDTGPILPPPNLFSFAVILPFLFPPPILHLHILLSVHLVPPLPPAFFSAHFLLPTLYDIFYHHLFFLLPLTL